MDTTLVESRGQRFTAAQPWCAEILSRHRVSGQHSSRNTWMLRLDLRGSDLQWMPGDSVGIVPKNPLWVVERTLRALHLDPTAEIRLRRQDRCVTALEYLTSHVTLQKVGRAQVQWLLPWAEGSTREELERWLAPEQGAVLQARLAGSYLYELIEAWPCPLDPVGLLHTLPSITPRFYSICNSFRHAPTVLDLLVADVQIHPEDRTRQGLCSSFLIGEEGAPIAKVPLFVFPTKRFHLPDDPTRPLLMIGPGTGVAPFRAFLQERIALGAQGKNWLFFGERQENEDFYFRTELMDWVAAGHLQLTTAFSRDQEERIYVQHRLRSAGKEVWEWLQEGAVVYVCGDAKRMAKDVQATFCWLAEEHGGVPRDQVAQWLAERKAAGLYLEDTY